MLRVAYFIHCRNWLTSDCLHPTGFSKRLQLLGISTVAANQTVDKVTDNALRICEAAGLAHIGMHVWLALLCQQVTTSLWYDSPRGIEAPPHALQMWSRVKPSQSCGQRCGAGQHTCRHCRAKPCWCRLHGKSCDTVAGVLWVRAHRSGRQQVAIAAQPARVVSPATAYSFTNPDTRFWAPRRRRCRLRSTARRAWTAPPAPAACPRRSAPRCRARRCCSCSSASAPHIPRGARSLPPIAAPVWRNCLFQSSTFGRCSVVRSRAGYGSVAN